MLQGRESQTQSHMKVSCQMCGVGLNPITHESVSGPCNTKCHQSNALQKDSIIVIPQFRHLDYIGHYP